MKLNKFLAVAVAATVLPLSVAHAEGPATQPELPEFTGGVNPADAPVLEKPEFKGGVNGEGLVADEKPTVKVRLDGTIEGKTSPAVNNVPEFKGGVNGPGLVQPELKPYGASLVAPEVHTKPEFKLPAGTSSDDTFGPRKGQAPAKAQNGHKTLPKTSAVK